MNNTRRGTAKHFGRLCIETHTVDTDYPSVILGVEFSSKMDPESKRSSYHIDQSASIALHLGHITITINWEDKEHFIDIEELDSEFCESCGGPCRAVANLVALERKHKAYYWKSLSYDSLICSECSNPTWSGTLAEGILDTTKVFLYPCPTLITERARHSRETKIAVALILAGDNK